LAAQQTPQPLAPSFQSGGIKATVTSIAADRRDKSRLALSLVLENKTAENLMVAVIGPPIGTNAGADFWAQSVAGVTYCANNDARIFQPTTGDYARNCLSGDKPPLSYLMFTLIEAGNAVPVTISLSSIGHGGMEVQTSSDFSYAMSLAVFKESDLPNPASAPNALKVGSPAGTPPSLRYLSIGVAAISITNSGG
jgi:hypothetical protein